MDTTRDFRVPLPDKIKKGPLPPLNVWSRAVDKTSVIGAILDVKIINYHWSPLKWCKRYVSAYCVVGSKGYLIIYKDTKMLIGYALDLTAAKKVSVAKRVGRKKCAKVTIDWKFGKITLSLDMEEVLARRYLNALFDACKCARAESDIREGYYADSRSDSPSNSSTEGSTLRTLDFGVCTRYESLDKRETDAVTMPTPVLFALPAPPNNDDVRSDVSLSSSLVIGASFPMNDEIRDFLSRSGLFDDPMTSGGGGDVSSLGLLISLRLQRGAPEV